MSRLKANLENVAAIKIAATPTQAECSSAAVLAHQIASDATMNVETRGSFSALADELQRTPEKVTTADPRAARLLNQLVTLANSLVPTTT
jgi:metal-sulfur cluster biosynthetic enzyme